MNDRRKWEISRRNFLRTSAGLGAGMAFGGLVPLKAHAQEKTLDMWWWGEQELPGLQKFVDISIAAYKEATVKAMLDRKSVV